jgi:hypothetical protein
MAGVADRYELGGTISAAGFASGDRFVVGVWTRSPIGPFADVMWARPDGTRALLVGSPRAGAFVGSVYRFDETLVADLDARCDGRTLTVVHPRLALRLEGGRSMPLGPARPAWFTRRVEGPIARRVMGVATFGTSPSGVHEWYRATGLRWVVRGAATLDGHDLGALGPVDPPTRFGFSEPPRRPAIVRVRPRLADPLGAVRLAGSTDAP